VERGGCLSGRVGEFQHKHGQQKRKDSREACNEHRIIRGGPTVLRRRTVRRRFFRNRILWRKRVPKPQQGGADNNGVPGKNFGLIGDALLVDISPVLATQVSDIEAVAGAFELGMAAADGRVLEAQVDNGSSANNAVALHNLEGLVSSWALLNEEEEGFGRLLFREKVCVFRRAISTR